jgi:hypothetical protein
LERGAGRVRPEPGERKFLTALSASFGIELEREEKTIKALTGKIRVDEDELNRAICALCADIRKANLRVVAYLDNIDELDHRYNTPQQREAVQHDVEGVLKLCRAPIALVLNMRTYFSSILRREAGDTRPLQRLQAQDLWGVLRRRMDPEPPHILAAYQQETCQKAIETLVQRSPTPLALLVFRAS